MSSAQQVQSGLASRRITLRTKFLLAMVVISAALTSGLLLVVQETMRTRARNELAQELQRSIHTFQSFNGRREALSLRMVDLLANLPSVSALLRSRDSNAIQDQTTSIAAVAGGQMFVLADANGQLVALHTNSVMGPQLVQPLLDRATSGKRSSDWWYADGHLYEVFFEPVRSSAEKDSAGLLGFGYEVDSRLASDISNVADAQVVFLYGNTPVVGTLPTSLQELLDKKITELLQTSRISSVEITLDEEKYLATALPLQSTPGKDAPAIVVLKSFDRSTEFISSLNRLMLTLGLIALAAGAALVFLVARSFTRPIQELLTGVQALEKGDYSYPLVPRGSDEVSELTAAFARMRETLRRNQEGMLQSARMEALGQLAGGVAHDFNNLVTIISGYSELAQDQVPAESPVVGHLQQIKEAGRRASGLTRQLLAFSRKQMLQPEVLDVNALVKRFGNMLRVLIGENIEIVLRLGEGVPQVLADAGQLEQIIINLSVNARDAMPRGGRLEISTAAATSAALRVKSERDENFLRLTVRDSGTGIEPATLAHIFEPFFTTKDPGKGTGLGLATVYGIVKQSGGHIDVESEMGKGSAFHIYLPAHTGTRADVKEAPEANFAGSATVLIVEDEDSLRSLIAVALSGKKYDVLQAKDGVAGIELAKSHDGKIELVITDVVMPRLGGREMISLLAKERPELRVLYISGYTEHEVAEFELGPRAAFLQKPFTPRELIQKVQMILSSPVAQ